MRFSAFAAISACALAISTPVMAQVPAGAGVIKHVIILMKENHTYDNYFGKSGIGDGATQFEEGSGLSRKDRVTPGATGRLPRRPRSPLESRLFAGRVVVAQRALRFRLGPGAGRGHRVEHAEMVNDPRRLAASGLLPLCCGPGAKALRSGFPLQELVTAVPPPAPTGAGTVPSAPS